MNATYSYWLVRYVPDVARGERVNVAVIAGRDGGDWAIRVVSDLRRASRLGGDASALRPWLNRLEQSFADYEQPPLFGDASARISRAWVDLLSHRFNNLIQVSAPAPVEAASASAAVDFLFPVLVKSPAPSGRSRTRTRLLGDMNEFFVKSAQLEQGKNLFRRPLATIGRQRGRFDFAVAGEAAGQLSQVFAFDVRDLDALEQELHSWNYIVSRIRSDGGDLIANGARTLAVAEDIPISVVYQHPAWEQNNQVRDVFAAALEAWQTLQVTPVPSEQLDEVAREARSLVSS